MIRSSLLLSLLGSLWFVGVAVGMGLLINYEVSPGKEAPAPAAWQDSGALTAARDLPTLIMFIHPQCACSRASIGEFSEIMAHVQGKVTAFVVFLAPHGADEEWVKTDLWRSASAIPGVTIVADDDGGEAERFGAATSGQVYLYDAEGGLAYSGGITRSRGHYGGNRGRSSVIAEILGHDAATDSNPVFGCEIFRSAVEAGATTGAGAGGV